MTNDSFFALMCMSMLAMLFGLTLAFGGYRFFLFLLPVWGFFFGFGFGAQTVHAIFGTGFLADITSWVVGFFVALVFAALSYLFYICAVAFLAGSLGYAVGAGIMLAIFPDLNFIGWLVGIAFAVVFIIGVLALNIQKYVIIAATGIQGALVIVGTFLFMLGGLPAAEVAANPVRAALQSSPFWMIIFIIVAGLAIVSQVITNRRFEIDTYNRWESMDSTTAVGA